MSFPIISIVTVTYNASSVLEGTILSVLSQSYANIEYIIIDGGSTDETIDIIKKYEDRISYWVSEPDKGIYDAMNKGIELASGQWINFMNAGDSFCNKDVLQNLLMYLDGKVDVIYGDTYLLKNEGKILKKRYPFSKIEKHMPFCHQSSFVKTELLKEIPFDVSYKYAADYAFFYNLYKNNKPFLFIDLAIANYDTYGSSSLNHDACMIEYARVRGVENSLKFKVYRFIINLYLSINKTKVR